MIKNLKNGLSMVSSTDLDNWDLQLPRILFGYGCSVQASIKFFLFMVLIGRTPRLTCEMNFLHSLMWKKMNSPCMR
jgi:hypothetical protein